MLDPRAIALQGVGYPSMVLALNGLYDSGAFVTPWLSRPYVYIVLFGD